MVGSVSVFFLRELSSSLRSRNFPAQPALRCDGTVPERMLGRIVVVTLRPAACGVTRRGGAREVQSCVALALKYIATVGVTCSGSQREGRMTLIAYSKLDVARLYAWRWRSCQ